MVLSVLVVRRSIIGLEQTVIILPVSVLKVSKWSKEVLLNVEPYALKTQMTRTLLDFVIVMKVFKGQDAKTQSTQYAQMELSW